MPAELIPDNIEDDPLRQAQTEVRHLKATIAALREEMENLSIGREQAVQAARAENFDELKQMRETAARCVRRLRICVSKRTAPCRKRWPMPTTKSSN